MSVALGFINGGHFYANVAKPILINLNFIVDSTNGNGLGVRSIKSNGYVENVFMHTTATPGLGKSGITNPNPAAGFAVIQLKQNFNKYLGGFSGFVGPIATSTKIDNSALTVGQAYVIGVLGNSTAAQWASIGVMPGVTPAVGVSFIATAVGISGEANTSTSRVFLPVASGITSVEAVGDTSLATTAQIASQGGMFLIVSFMGPTSSSVTTAIPTAPAAGSVCGMSMLFDGSSVTIDGI